jgi:SAM-dependent methyltransferase
MKDEELFHDQWAETLDHTFIRVDDFFEACTAPENRLILKKIGNVANKKILEIGCGGGEASVYFAKRGAQVMAIDISRRMLSVAQRLAQRNRVSIQFQKALSDHLPYPDETFDIVYAVNLLHHVTIESTVKEAARVLKESGIFASWDPLAHNPLINIYRRMAKEVRTVGEHPLKISDLKKIKKYFGCFEYHTTWFLTLYFFLKFYFIDRVNPNQVRYWRKIIEDHKKIESLYIRLARYDDFLLKRISFLRKYCWNVVVIAHKQ